MKNSLLGILCIALMATACMDDIDVDKVSGKINIKPTLLLPLVYADVNTEYLFDKAANAVEFYTAEDGSQRIRIKANHDSISAYPIMDALGFMNSSKSFLTELDLEMLNYGGEAYTPIILDIIDKEGASINSLQASCNVTVKYNGFSRDANINMDLFGKDIDMPIGGSNSDGEKTESVENVTITPIDGKVTIPITVKLSENGYGSWGSIEIGIQLYDIDNVNCSISGLTVPTSTCISLTHLQNFKRLGRNSEFKDPRFWLTSTNKSQLDGRMKPNICSIGDGKVTLNNDAYEIPAGKIGITKELDEKNSNVQGIFQNVPDSMSYTADLELSMPDGNSNITISKKDTIYLGYRYDVPFDIKIDGDIECDTAFISDVPDLDFIKRAKIVCTTTNSLPFGGDIKMQLANIGEHKMLSYINLDNALACPQISESGISLDNIENVSVVELNDQNLKDIGNADAIIVSIRLNSKGNFVAPKKGDRLIVDVSFAAGFEIEN